MADYNVNMKQWNGTSFDNVLPLAYMANNAGKLDGKTYQEIIQYAQSKNLLLYTGQYRGAGVYGYNNPNSITFPFEPILLLPPFQPGERTRGCFMSTALVSENYNGVASFFPPAANATMLRFSSDRKTLEWYNDTEYAQSNQSNATYYYAAIGGYDMGGKLPVGSAYTITSNQSWRVPATGRWTLELYGMGGNGFGNQYACATGGASCQHYDSITLTKGDFQQVIIGDDSNPATKFGSYSVSNGGHASSSAGGLGSGNYGKNGTTGSYLTLNFSSGALAQNYGYGGNWEGSRLGGPGAVYLKYLGE